MRCDESSGHGDESSCVGRKQKHSVSLVGNILTNRGSHGRNDDGT